jgi:hypothetical protein
MPAEPVHDRDGVDEHVKRPRARPQRQHEAERDHVEPAAAQHLVECGLDELMDRRGRDHLRCHVQDAMLEELNLGDVVTLRDVADGSGQAEDQRRKRQDREKRRFSSESGDSVRETGRRRARCEPTQRGAQLVPRHGDYRSHMRTLTAAAIFGAVTTFSSALALRAPDATIAVAATAAITAFVAWLAILHSTDEASGLALTSPAAALTLAAVRRTSGATLLPLVAAQVVGAVAGGFAALGLNPHLGGALTWPAPTPVAVVACVGVLAIVLSWIVLAVDGGESALWTGIGPILIAAALGVGLASVLNPAAAVGLATAGVVSWTTAAIAAGVGLVGAYVGAYAIGLVTPPDATTE